MAGLLSLLAQAVAPQAANVTNNSDILVTARKNEPREMDAAPRALGNRMFLEEAQDAAGKAPQRKGMFGVKGTLRDVLGTLGDAFLIQSGNKAMYAPRREQEKAGDALAGFTQDPLAAIERLAYENPDMAAQVYNDYMSNQAKQAQVQSVTDNRNSLAADRSYKQKQDFGNYAARLLAKADTPERQAAAMRVINTRAQALGIDPSELGITDSMSEDERSVLGAGDMTVNQQETLPIRKYQAETSRISATKPPAPKNPPRRSYGDVEAEAFDTPADKRTPEQQRIVDKRLEKGRTRGSGRRSSSSGEESSGGKLVFRNGKLVRQ